MISVDLPAALSVIVPYPALCVTAMFGGDLLKESLKLLLGRRNGAGHRRRRLPAMSGKWQTKQYRMKNKSHIGRRNVFTYDRKGGMLEK